MPLITDMEVPLLGEMDAPELAPSYGQRSAAAFKAALASNTLARVFEWRTALISEDATDTMQYDDAVKEMRAAGIQGNLPFDPNFPVSRSWLDITKNRMLLEQRSAYMEQAAGGSWYSMMPAGFVASSFDPVMWASMGAGKSLLVGKELGAAYAGTTIAGKQVLPAIPSLAKVIPGMRQLAVAGTAEAERKTLFLAGKITEAEYQAGGSFLATQGLGVAEGTAMGAAFEAASAPVNVGIGAENHVVDNMLFMSIFGATMHNVNVLGSKVFRAASRKAALDRMNNKAEGYKALSEKPVTEWSPEDHAIFDTYVEESVKRPLTEVLKDPVLVDRVMNERSELGNSLRILAVDSLEGRAADTPQMAEMVRKAVSALAENDMNIREVTKNGDKYDFNTVYLATIMDRNARTPLALEEMMNRMAKAEKEGRDLSDAIVKVEQEVKSDPNVSREIKMEADPARAEHAAKAAEDAEPLGMSSDIADTVLEVDEPANAGKAVAEAMQRPEIRNNQHTVKPDEVPVNVEAERVNLDAERKAVAAEMGVDESAIQFVDKVAPEDQAAAQAMWEKGGNTGEVAVEALQKGKKVVVSTEVCRTPEARRAKAAHEVAHGLLREMEARDSEGYIKAMEELSSVMSREDLIEAFGGEKNLRAYESMQGKRLSDGERTTALIEEACARLQERFLDGTATELPAWYQKLWAAIRRLFKAEDMPEKASVDVAREILRVARERYAKEAPAEAPKAKPVDLSVGATWKTKAWQGGGVGQAKIVAIEDGHAKIKVDDSPYLDIVPLDKLEKYRAVDESQAASIERNAQELQTAARKTVADAEAYADSAEGRFVSTKSPMLAGKAKQALAAQINRTGMGVVPIGRMVEKMMAEGYRVSTVEGQRVLMHPDGEQYLSIKKIGKTAVDYAEFLANEPKAEQARFSIADQDYMRAAEAGDEATAQKLVEEAGRAAKYTKELYHSGSFDVEAGDKVLTMADDSFGVHFGSKRAATERMSGKIYDDEIASIKVEFGENMDGEEGWIWSSDILGENETAFASKAEAKMDAERTIMASDELAANAEDTPMTPVLAKFENPLRLPDLETWKFEATRRTVSATIPDAINATNFAELRKAITDAGYDSIVYKNMFEDKGSDSYIAITPESVKYRGIVRDDAGRIIPLSERFNPAKDDIRFSVKAPTTEAEKVGEAHMLASRQYKDRTLFVQDVIFGGERQKTGAGSSVTDVHSTKAMQYFASTVNQLTDGKLNGTGINLRRVLADKNQAPYVGRAVWDINNSKSTAGYSKAIQKTAEIFHGTLESIRQEFIKMGVKVGHLNQFITSMSHDSLKIRAAGKTEMEAFRAWKADILPLLDQAATFTARGIKAQSIDKSLLGMFDGIVSGIHEGAKGTGKGGSLAERIEASALLVFKDADSWMKYNEKYGAGRLDDAFFKHIEHNVRNLALLRVFGKDYEAAFKSMLTQMELDIKHSGRPEALTEAREFASQRDAMMRMLDHVDGTNNRIANRTWDTANSWLKTLMRMSKLKSAVVASFADQANLVSGIHLTEQRGFINAIGTNIARTIRFMSSVEQRRYLRQLGAMTDSLTNSGLMAAMDGQAPATRVNQFVNAGYFKVTLLHDWVNMIRGLSADSVMTHFGEYAGKPWKSLPEYNQKQLARFDIGEAEWNQHFATVKAAKVDMAYWLTPDLIANEEMRFRYLTLIQHEMRVNSAEPTARTTWALHGGHNIQKGTPLALLVDNLLMFKSYMVSSAQGPMSRIALAAGDESVGAGLTNWKKTPAQMAAHAAMMTFAGGVAYVAKGMLANEKRSFADQRGDVDKLFGMDFDWVNEKAVAHSFMLGGFASGMPDVLFADWRNFLLGPWSSNLTSAGGLVSGFREDKGNAKLAAIKFAQQNTPSTFWDNYLQKKYFWDIMKNYAKPGVTRAEDKKRAEMHGLRRIEKVWR